MKVQLIETLAGKAILVDNRVIVLSELVELTKPNLTISTTNSNWYGIYYKLKGSSYYSYLFDKQFYNNAQSQVEVDKYLKDLLKVYDEIIQNWKL